MTPASTPAAAGYHMPAEWDAHAATWIGWPHNTSDWPGKFAPVPWAYGEIVRWLAGGERVRILVASVAHEARARKVLGKVGVDPGQIDFLPFPTNRGWTRDFGPLFVRRAGGRGKAIVDFRFNAWAKYRDWQLDDRVAGLAAAELGLPLFEARVDGRPFVLEGGSVDVNGRGTVLTTEECLLDPVVQTRNPGLSREETETALGAFLGAPRVIWLGRGIAGDDTHGHVDDLCRFVAPGTVVLCREDDPRDENHHALAENRERLEGATLEDGSRLEVVDLPMPRPVHFDGVRLPASYANFYVANAAVLVPTFNDPADRVALGILGELFQDRPVVGIHALDLVWGLGTLHCLTQQEPA